MRLVYEEFRIVHIYFQIRFFQIQSMVVLYIEGTSQTLQYIANNTLFPLLRCNGSRGDTSLLNYFFILSGYYDVSFSL